MVFSDTSDAVIAPGGVIDIGACEYQAVTDVVEIYDLSYVLSPDDQLGITFDISTWLDGDYIKNVAYTAIDNTGADATATVLDSSKNFFSLTSLNPYIQGGVSGRQYVIKALVTTMDGDIKVFYIRFTCHEKAG